MRFLYRLTWDAWSTPWEPVPADYLHKLVHEGVGLIMQVKSPTDWQFNLHMLNQMDGHVAVEATLVQIHLKAVK